MNRIIWTLKQPVFTILDKLVTAGWGHSRAHFPHVSRWSYRAATDVVLPLHFCCRDEVLTQFESSPASFIQSDSQVGSDQSTFAQFQFMPRRAVDNVDAKVLFPVFLHAWLHKAFDDQSQRVNVLGNGFKPSGIFFAVVWLRCQQLNHAAQAPR